MTDLRECPFCGCEAAKLRHDYYDLYKIECKKCRASSQFISQEKTIENWNTRTQDKRIKEQKRELDIVGVGLELLSNAVALDDPKEQIQLRVKDEIERVDKILKERSNE